MSAAAACGTVWKDSRKFSFLVKHSIYSTTKVNLLSTSSFDMILENPRSTLLPSFHLFVVSSTSPSVSLFIHLFILFFCCHDTLFFCFSPVISSGKMEQESWDSGQVEVGGSGGGGDVMVSLRKTGWRGGEGIQGRFKTG